MIEFWHPLNPPMVFLFGKSKIFISNSKKLFWLLIYGFCPLKTIQPFQKTESRLFNSSILSKLYLSQLFIRYSISLKNEKKHENSIVKLKPSKYYDYFRITGKEWKLQKLQLNICTVIERQLIFRDRKTK